MKYSILTVNLNEYEQGLIKEQLRILHGRTNAQWFFAGEGIDGDLVIAKKPIEVPDWTQLAVLNNDYYSTDEEHFLHVDWPLRIIGLLELLTRAEHLLTQKNAVLAHHSSDNTSQLPSELIVDICSHLTKHQMLTMSFNGQMSVLYHSDIDNEIIIQLENSSSETTDELIKSPIESIHFNLHPYPNETEIQTVFSNTIPLPEFLWELALKEPIKDKAHWHSNDKKFHIERWPMLGVWYTEPTMFHMAAILGRGFEPLSKIAEASGTSVHQVASFIHACNTVSLGVEAHDITEVTIQKNKTNRSESINKKGFLSKLRSKLGLVLSI